MKKYQNDLASLLRSFKSKNPKTYWDYINTKKKSTKNEKQPSCEEFADMFNRRLPKGGKPLDFFQILK